ncbi:hypothetical protein [Bradyrhizobium sp. LMTR 3]|uniref:hypothetical protein n=1 Tax=Bradyrhizobium sp. LMTR 3 TaxID=189873 RepID=UPI00081069FA|nr:hypothetical protein [Bradyrhizobium sp. LMTR 3]OCK54021.1 hypothetical protein LMTR3_22860 [Bradyrhizobium sp. LMTR 3]
MRAVDIAAYFTKKIAKPIQIDVEFQDDHFFYTIEPTAVAEDTVHVPVSTKYEMWFGEKAKREEYIGEVAVPRARRRYRPERSRHRDRGGPLRKWQREHRDPRA